MDKQIYDLSDPPLMADLKAHAAAITAAGFVVSSQTLGDWPLAHAVINGKRQPETSQVWAYAVVMLPGERLQARMLDRMGATFRAEVEARLEGADEARQRVLAKRAEENPSGVTGRGSVRRGAVA